MQSTLSYNIRFLLLGVLMSVCSLNAQLLSEPHSLDAQLDLLGITAFPLQALFSNSLESRHRLQAGVRYSYKDRFSGSYAMGTDRRDRTRVRKTLEEYRFRSVYHQMNGCVHFNPSGRYNPGVGMGFMFGKKEEEGIVRIGDTYFSPYEQPLHSTSTFSGFRFLFDHRYSLHDRVALSLEVSYVDLKFNEPDDTQVISTVPSAGPSLLTSRRDALGFGFALYLAYRL